MTSYLVRNNILLFDYTKFADPLREKIRTNAEHLAASNNLTIEFIRSSKARKEDIVKKYFDGKKTGLIYILSAIEACPSYVPWYDKVSHKTFLMTIRYLVYVLYQGFSKAATISRSNNFIPKYLLLNL